MRALLLLAGFAAAVTVTPSFADPDKDESGHGRWKGHNGRFQGRECKEEYWDGGCKVERKVGKRGEYKEERKCRGHAGAPVHQAPVYGAPVYGVPAPGVVVQPPAVVIQPPPIFVR